MKRLIDFSALPWKDSVYSAIVRNELKACYERLMLLSQNGETDLSMEKYSLVGSYEAEERKTTAEYTHQDFVNELLAMGTQEENLLKLMIINDGRLPVPAAGAAVAESLVRRGWCTLDTESTVSLVLKDDISQYAVSTMNTDIYLKSRELMFRLEAVVYSIVFMYGYANTSLISEIVLSAVEHTGINLEKRFFLRSMKCFLDYVCDGTGNEYLIHAALRDPMKLIGQEISYTGKEVRIDIQHMAGGMNSCLPGERNAVEAFETYLERNCRPESNPAEIRENIYYMAKQGTDESEMIRILNPELMFSAPKTLQTEIEKLLRAVIPWGMIDKGVIN